MDLGFLKGILDKSAFGKSIKTLKRQDERGLLYHMDYSGDYYLLLPVMQKMMKTGCSTFVHKNLKGEPIMGRNFDLRHFWTDPKTGETKVTGLCVVVNVDSPCAKYKSVALADAVYLDPGHPTFYEGCLDNGETDLMRTVALPFLCMDGVNEKGLAVAVMHLSTENRWDEIPYRPYEELSAEEKANMRVFTEPGEAPDPKDARTKKGALAMNTADRKAWKVYKDFGCHQERPGKKPVIHTVLMRMMLDKCATVEEAVKLADSCNMISTPDADNHIMVADANGKCVVLEWIHNELKVTEIDHATNFSTGREDHYGYGFERDDVMAAAKRKYNRGMPESIAMHTMAVASQNCEEDSDFGFTQWSAVYNLPKGTVDVCVHMDYEHVYRYHI